MRDSSPTVNLLRTLFVSFTACIGSGIGGEFFESPKTGIGIGIAFGLAIILADRLLKGFTLRMFSSATFGLFLGFVAARLLLASGILYTTPERQQWLIALAVYATFSYLGMMLAMRGNRDEFALIIPFIRFRQQDQPDAPVLVDSNIIIEGRLADIAFTGFIGNTFVIPRFILEELQLIGDSSDPARRERGRAALARVQEWQRDQRLNIIIHEAELGEFGAVDARLIQLAKMLNARLLSNDSNLCSIARIEGVRALNCNELSRILRSNLSAGDDVEITLTKEGRETHQAVGYLKDGTMVVVNHARPLIGQTVKVAISSVLQTSAGRLHFAELEKTAA